MNTNMANHDIVEGGFEGPEKKLEIDFRVVRGADFDSDGLRVISQDEWSDILTLAKCSILSKTSNEHFDAYVLSESSLFVYPTKIMIKTCGTTTLLNTVSRILELGKRCALEVDFVFYSRKNYNFPTRQLFPHFDFKLEVEYLNRNFPQGQAYILGDVTGDHWHLFVADYSGLHGNDQTLEIMMSELDPKKMAQFYKTESFVSAKHTTKTSGIADIIPGSTIDEFQFEPCGYSMNGLKEGVYSTIHITPEPHCCYVSFDTNLPQATYTKIVAKVVEVFQPGKFQVALFLDRQSPAGLSSKCLDTKFSSAYCMRQKQKIKFPGNKYFVRFYSFSKNTNSHEKGA
eukprot:TRINITY_DN4181_c0_g1_i1.p1 TRINITY_DN4181_c0_g1~~TRINITY_DN4181_c0_g1_i1.p1  ORF type:complete len:343 (-),score=73.34 TRINITY_DN4181_c0_g1_i1:42-1070(-)